MYILTLLSDNLTGALRSKKIEIENIKVLHPSGLKIQVNVYTSIKIFYFSLFLGR